MTMYVLSAAAEADLDAIWEYIALDNVDAADRWIGRLFAAFEALAQTPGMGHKREDLTSFPVYFLDCRSLSDSLSPFSQIDRDRSRDARIQGHPRISEPTQPMIA